MESAFKCENIHRRKKGDFMLKILKVVTFLLSILGLVFACTPGETEPKYDDNPKPSSIPVTIKITNAADYEDCDFYISGTLNDNYLAIPKSNGDSFNITVSKGDLSLFVQAKKGNTVCGLGEVTFSLKEKIELSVALTSNFSNATVTFEANGGSTVEPKTVISGVEIGTLPVSTKAGFVLDGWYLDATFVTKVSSLYKVSKDVTLYAKWISATEKLTVIFKTNGGSTVAAQSVNAGEKIETSPVTTKTDYEFSGWYSDSALTQAVSFPFTVTSNCTLYAKWTEKNNVVYPESITLSQTSVEISQNDTITLNAIVSPTNATNKTITWTSSNESVATVAGGVITGVSKGSANIIATVTGKDGKSITATCLVTVSDSIIPVESVSIAKGNYTVEAGATLSAPLTVTVLPADATNKSVIWSSSNESVATVDQNGNVKGVAAGTVTITAISHNAKSDFVNVTVSGPINGKTIVFVKADSAPKFWVWEPDGEKISEKMGFEWNNQDSMKTVEAGLMNDSTGWFMYDISSYASGKAISFILNQGGTVTTDKTGTFWYDGTNFYDADPTKPREPEVPTITISPANGKEVAANGSISVSVFDGYAQITALNVTVSGAVSKTYGISDFNNGTLNISVASLGLKEGDSVTINATVTNTKGSDSDSSILKVKEPSTDFFTWDNVNAYFVLTDRFANGDTANDHSYSRKNGLSGDENVATFHGGDIKGLTQNMDYFKKLGINAIWITAPYEQVHGWVSGKGHKFPHYAFHGYYTLDWTFMDKNMGTIDEFREFVQTCHANGIRVIMDVVINHVGYNNTEDMITYNHGGTDIKEHGWLAKANGCGGEGCAMGGSNCWFANYTTKWDNSLWDTKWWGRWARSFGHASGSEYGGSCGGLPDVKSEDSDKNIGIAPILKTKWSKEDNSSYDKWRVPAVANVDWWNKSGNWRTNQTARIVEYQCVWLSAWVREFGIDGFRCDTAKHVEPQYWGMLKDACTDALKKWRADDSKVDNSGAKDWDEAFWMTGECWGWTSTGGGGEYYSTGKFDSMINFSFNDGNNWDGNYRTGYPQSSAWNSYVNINKNGDSDGNGHRDNVLTYISSHDTGLTRVGDQYEVGTGLVLLPGGVQIYYGDESNREKAYTGCGDGDMMTRGDMNLSQAKTSALTAHWGKVGNFRKYNPAVGAGTGSGTKRTYTGNAGDNKVAIGISGSSVDVSGLFADGVTVYNWYDGKSATVSGGKVSFSGGSMKQPILVSDRNPADCGVTF